jgi:hypothetical protein
MKEIYELARRQALGVEKATWNEFPSAHQALEAASRAFFLIHVKI